MLTRVEVQKFNGSVLSLPLADISGGYIITEIDGLDPVNASIVTKPNAQSDGVQIQSARRDSRNITMKVKFYPDWVTNSIGSLKQQLFGYFKPTSVVTLSFYLDDILTAITERAAVETCSNNPFSADPEVDISLICPDPDFSGGSSVDTPGSTVTDTTTTTVNYLGTSDCGVIFTLTAGGSLSGFTLYNTRPDGTIQQFNVTAAMVAGDIITVNSIPGQKSVILNHAGLETSVLYAVDPTSTWISLQEGVNQFRAHAATAGVPFTLSYTPKYDALPN